MADVKTCRNCRNIFTDFVGRGLCSKCMQEEDIIFNRVRDYIRENPNATIFSTAEACEVSERQIRQWLKEERLVYRNEEGSGLYCEKCGCPIAFGRYCQNCKMALSREFGAIMRENQAPKQERKAIEHGSKMRFLNRG